MRFPIHIPLIIRNVRILGPKGSVKVDMIVDTGAALTAISWSDLKLVGYDPAIVAERQETLELKPYPQAKNIFDNSSYFKLKCSYDSSGY